MKKVKKYLVVMKNGCNFAARQYPFSIPIELRRVIFFNIW